MEIPERLAGGHSGRKLTRRALAVTIVIALALVAAVPSVVLLTATDDHRAAPSFGNFAGYVWPGRVRSVSASWSVPTIAADSPPGIAGTWIGAQAPGFRPAFLQLGVTEDAIPPTSPPSSNARYFAFWSDTHVGFRAQVLFPVSAGDRISASLTLTRRWTLDLRDVSSGKRARFSTSDESTASFRQAEWTQEDPPEPGSSKPYPYPRLTPTTFQGVQINVAVPSYGELYSRWLSLTNTNLAPTPLRRDAFTLTPATLSPDAAAYLQIARRFGASESVFLSQVAGLTPAPTGQMQSARATFIRALLASINALRGATWRSAEQQIRRLIADLRALRAQVQPVPSSAEASARWRLALVHGAEATRHDDRTVRRALGAPELTS